MSKKYKKIHYNLTIQLNIQKMVNFQTKVNGQLSNFSFRSSFKLEKE